MTNLASFLSMISSLGLLIYIVMESRISIKFKDENELSHNEHKMDIAFLKRDVYEIKEALKVLNSRLK